MVYLSQFVPGSSSSSPIDRYRYDVFLSFRGADTRRSFTDHLHKALLDATITTFLDDKGIETGEDLKPEVESAIEASRASIIVLSKNYASSSWCLDELVLILEQRLSSNHTVIPIFYHVEPSHIGRQESSFGFAIAEHEQKMGAEADANKRSERAQKIDRWKKALKEVASLEGVDVNGRLETEIIEEIVEEINCRLHVSSRIPVQQLVGMDDSIKSVTSWLKDESADTADVLSIVGMGGIGKTSLAKYIYGFHSHEFDRSSFIEDISRRCFENLSGLLSLQNQLYDDISEPTSVQVHDASGYTSMIENAVARRKVLLVLDDTDNLGQLDALLGSKGFHPGSKVIVTTRHAQLTASCALFKTSAKPRHAMHLIRGLSDTASQELLCFHAFMSNEPKAGYEEVSDKLVKHCQGLPLALKVLGKSLHNRGVAYWEECLERLKKGCGSPIDNVLRKSFDSLPSEIDKDLFKHIACFFVGVDRDVTETILNGCGIAARSGITNLVDRCLLSVGCDKNLKMHRLLQEMGRFIVHQESPDKPWKRTRLWRHEESFEVLERKKGTEKVVGLSLDMRMLENVKLRETFALETGAFSGMANLKLLQLNHVRMSGSYDKLPKCIRWLCMHGSRLNSIPFDLPMENLVALDLSYSNVDSFDICYRDPLQPHKRQKQVTGLCSKDRRPLESLKIINLSFCQNLRRLGGFERVPRLERLIATNCSRLRKLSKSIRKCRELVLIDLSYCSQLEELPRTIGMLHKLQTLLLDGCNLISKSREIDSPEGIPSDSKLLAISLPRSLVRLSLANGNLSTKSFPMDLSRLRVLQELCLYGYDLGESQIEISTNPRPSPSAILKAIPSGPELFKVLLPESLVRLSLNNNNLSTESFPSDLSFLSTLKELYLDGNPIVSLPNSVRSLPSLEVLSMSNCQMLTSVEHPPHTLRELILHFDSKPLLRKLVFDPEMSPVKLSVDLPLFAPLSFEIEGMVKIQPMAYVEEALLRRLGWSNVFSVESEIQMYYEFGIFSTIYGGKEMPSWFTCRSAGTSISFTIPSSPNNLKGLNFCSVHALVSLKKLFEVPTIAVRNVTKKQTWLYKHCIGFGGVGVGEECLIYLSHWMFGNNDMETGDLVAVTDMTAHAGLTKECGVSLVYDDGHIHDEEDVLGPYKSWTHIIGGDLSAYQTATGEYSLETALFALHVDEYYTEFGGQKRHLLK